MSGLLLIALSGMAAADPQSVSPTGAEQAGDAAVDRYWQQRVAYEIEASLDEPSGVLAGRALIRYVNQSPDTLRDFYVHQHLNAFRPGSRWAEADAAEGRVRFQRLQDPEYGFERITASSLMGVADSPDYPFAPDSTVAHWTLPRALAPGDSMTVEIAWQARAATVPRRQGRRGRRFDFAHWYPKVVVYDRLGWQAHPLYPAGEFYGEFATYDVTLDLPADQVIGATGVPVEGDPGWERARADGTTAVDYQRDWYAGSPRATPRGEGCGGRDGRAGRKCVRFHAEDVHHFAFTLNPDFVYEQGRYGGVVVRVLRLPEDTPGWGQGRAVGEVVAALAWLDTLFGTFPWPQVTYAHRLDRGATEFPMVVMGASAGAGLVRHEVGHQYTMGVLANNEWREGWLDEGFADFTAAWGAARRGGPDGYARLDSTVLVHGLDGWNEPIGLAGEDFRDFATYNRMIYDGGQLFLEQLRYVVGDAVMRAILREYYSRWRLRHVDETAFRTVAEEVARRDLGWLFGEWLHGTPTIDYRLRHVERRRLGEGRWRTTVTIERRGAGRMPVEIGDGDTIYARSAGLAETERVTFESARRPGRLLLDPRRRAHDWYPLNDEERGLRWVFSRSRVRSTRLDDPFRAVGRRDRRVAAWMPVVWSNAYGGLTLGLRERGDYLGRFDRSLEIASYALDRDATHRSGLYMRFQSASPAAPRATVTLAGWSVEGRAGALVGWARSLRRHETFGPDARAGFDALWMATTDLGYIDRRRWDDAGTIEAGPWMAVSWRVDSARFRARAGVRAGVLYWVPGIGVISRHRYDAEGFVRGTAEASVRAPFWLGSRLGARLFAGGYAGDSPPPRQRRIPVAGADPYETFTNPLLRSAGALFVRPDFQYHAPGNGNLRGFAAEVAGRWAVTANLELARTLLRSRRGVLRELAPFGFVDAGVVDPLAVASAPAGRAYTTLYDGGVGVAAELRIRDLGWTMRVEFPFVVNRWDRAADLRPGLARTAFRWQVSLAPSF